MNITFLTHEKKHIVFKTHLIVLNHNPTQQNSTNANWVIVHKLEYIGRFAPFSIFWRHNVAMIYAYISNVVYLTSSRNDVTSVLSIYYQIMELLLEIVSDQTTTMRVSKVTHYFLCIVECLIF